MQVGTVYILHFSRPYEHARHYVGWTGRTVSERLADHVEGRGSPLVAAAVADGIEVTVAAIEAGTRKRERQIKNSHNTARYCPLCRKERR